MAGDGIDFRVEPGSGSWTWRTLAPMSGGRVHAAVDGERLVLEFDLDFSRQTLVGAVVAGFLLTGLAALGPRAWPVGILLAMWAALFTLQRGLLVVRFGRLVERVIDDTAADADSALATPCILR